MGEKVAKWYILVAFLGEYNGQPTRQADPEWLSNMTELTCKFRPKSRKGSWQIFTAKMRTSQSEEVVQEKI